MSDTGLSIMMAEGPRIALGQTPVKADDKKIKSRSVAGIGATPLPSNRDGRGMPAASAPVPIPSQSPAKAAGRRRFLEIGELFVRGETIASLAARFAILPETVVQHLSTYQEAGGKLEPARLVAASRLSEEDRFQVLEIFGCLGMERLGPIYAALHGSVGYDELHLLRLYRKCILQGG